jgi:DNA-binding CsgD family transcriptional regulator
MSSDTEIVEPEIVSLDDVCFTDRDQQIIEMAARGDNQAKIAAWVGLSERQVNRLINKKVYADAISQLQRDTFKQRRRYLMSLHEEVTTCFHDIMRDEEANTFARISAATQLKNMILQSNEADLDDEINEMRRQLAEMEKRISSGGSDNGLKLLENSVDDE